MPTYMLVLFPAFISLDDKSCIGILPPVLWWIGLVEPVILVIIHQEVSTWYYQLKSLSHNKNYAIALQLRSNYDRVYLFNSKNKP